MPHFWVGAIVPMGLKLGESVIRTTQDLCLCEKIPKISTLDFQ